MVQLLESLATYPSVCGSSPEMTILSLTVKRVGSFL